MLLKDWWGAVGLAPVIGSGPLRDLLGLTLLPAAGWAMAVPLATVPVLATQGVRIWRDRGSMHRADTTDMTAAAK